MFTARKLVLAHFWVAFAAFLLAIVLGEWQMYVRSPLHGWVNNPEHYYRSVTLPNIASGTVAPGLAFRHARRLTAISATQTHDPTTTSTTPM